MANNNGGQVIAAAAILGLCVLGGAFLLSRSVDEAAQQLSAMSAAIAEVEPAAGRAAPAAPPDRQARRRPDPDRVYVINTEGSPAKGPDDAKITLVEFSDFQCPFCGRVGPTLKNIEKEYGDQVRIVFKHLPLSMHSKAPAAHAAAEAAGMQGKFWEMHDKIFENQREMSEENYVKWAGEMGLDVAKFKQDAASKEVRDRVERDLREASALGVTGTPSFFMNGRFTSGAKPYSEFKRMIDEQLKG